MKYNFEQVPDRREMSAIKWEIMKHAKSDIDADIVPFSVADMDLFNPPEITEGLAEYLKSGLVLGYTKPWHSYKDSIVNWMNRRHHWEIQEDWIYPIAGIVPAIYEAVRAFTEEGDGVLMLTPVYHPFYKAVEQNGRCIVKSSLINNEGRYEIDFEDLKQKAEDPGTKMLIFCSPHNPVGRVWAREELIQVGEICLANHLLIISDEIHFDLIMPGQEHTVLAAVSDDIRDQTITFTAPSKTFNLAGLHVSNAIIANEEIRSQFIKSCDRTGMSGVNMMGLKACEIAYTQCEAWADQMIELVYENYQYLNDFLAKVVPGAIVSPLEGTYLAWIDFRCLSMNANNLEAFMTQQAQIFFNEGIMFGEEGDGFERMTLACPKIVLHRALDRLKACLNEFPGN